MKQSPMLRKCYNKDRPAAAAPAASAAIGNSSFFMYL